MPEKTESCRIYVKKVEEGENNSLKVVFESKKYGYYYILVNREHLEAFCPGTEYEGIFKISGMADFIGEKEIWENVCTVSYSLEKIIGTEEFVKDGKGYSKVMGNCIVHLERDWEN